MDAIHQHLLVVLLLHEEFECGKSKCSFKDVVNEGLLHAWESTRPGKSQGIGVSRWIRRATNRNKPTSDSVGRSGTDAHGESSPGVATVCLKGAPATSSPWLHEESKQGVDI
jgi:hypothetical protein